MARAFGSYPECRWFESNCRYQFWPGGQEVKTPPFHGGIMGSIPVRVTSIKARKQRKYVVSEFLFYIEKQVCPLLVRYLDFCSGQILFTRSEEKRMPYPLRQQLSPVRSETDGNIHSKSSRNSNALTHPKQS